MISIVIIVKNEKDIKATLQSLCKIRKPEKIEIIVIDSSRKETLLDIKNKFPEVRWFYYLNKKNKKITIPEQRNMGIKKSKGDVIVFIDANCIPKKDWLVKLIAPIRREQEFFVTGLVESSKKNKVYDITWDKLSDTKYREEAGSANTAFKKEIIKKVGYYDENFDYGSDVEFSWRVVDKGYKIRYSPKAIISHDWGTFRQERKRAFLYGKARAKLYYKHRNRLSNLLKQDFLVLAYPLFILFLPIAILWPYYLLLILIPFLKNIKQSPFKTTFINLITGLGVLKGLFEELLKTQRDQQNKR